MRAPALQAYVVEDNVLVRENLVSALQELTCVRVLDAAATEEEGYAWLEHNGAAWDLLIVDLFLTTGNGIMLLQRVTRSRPQQKIIVFSNYVNPSVRKRCAMLGVDAVFDKSTEIDALVDYCARQGFEQAAAARAPQEALQSTHPDEDLHDSQPTRQH